MRLLYALASEIDRDGDKNGGHFANHVLVPKALYDVLIADMNAWRMDRGQEALKSDEQLFVRAIPVYPDTSLRIGTYK